MCVSYPKSNNLIINKNNKKMKKLLLVSLALMTLTVAKAQLKVFPTLKKGMEKVYVTNTTMALPGQPEVAMDVETKYTVSDATANGYVIDMVSTSSNATTDNIAGQILVAAQEMVKDVTIRVATDKNGKLLNIQNYDEVSKAFDGRSKQMTEKLYQLIPQMKDVISEDALKGQLMENLNMEALFRSIKEATSPLALFGKTIMTGAQEQHTNEQGLKLNRMYFVNGRAVTTSSTLNMSKDEIKQLIIAQVEKLAPAQADMIKKNIDQLIDSGMMKIDVKETATYDLQDDNWPKKLAVEVVNEVVGQKSVSKSTITLK